MPIRIERTAASPYLCYRFSGAITPDDLDRLASVEESVFTTPSEGECLGVIVDLSAIDTIAANLFPQLQHMRIVRDDRFCAICVVGANPYLRALWISLGLVRGRSDISFRQTTDDAISILDYHLQANRASFDG